MRVSELGRTAGQSVATIKYYLREGLLPAGDVGGAANQADYGERHVRRLALIRVLLHVAGIGVAAARGVVAAVDDPDCSERELLAVIHQTLPARRFASADDPDVVQARDEVACWLAARGWDGAGSSPPREQLADALVALRRLGWDAEVTVFAGYADLVDDLAREEVASLTTSEGRERFAESMVVGTMVFESALVALRRLAHERHALVLFATPRGQ